MPCYFQFGFKMKACNVVDTTMLYLNTKEVSNKSSYFHTSVSQLLAYHCHQHAVICTEQACSCDHLIVPSHCETQPNPSWWEKVHSQKLCWLHQIKREQSICWRAGLLSRGLTGASWSSIKAKCWIWKWNNRMQLYRLWSMSSERTWRAWKTAENESALCPHSQEGQLHPGFREQSKWLFPSVWHL